MPFQHSATAALACQLAGFTQPHEDADVAGINLAYLVDKNGASAGDQLTFTAWVLNSSSVPLTDVSLKLRSFSNSMLEPLQYKTQPTGNAMTHRILPPRRSLSFTLTYVVEARDVGHKGVLISAIEVCLFSPDHGRLHSECDAVVTMKPVSRNGTSGSPPATITSQ